MLALLLVLPLSMLAGMHGQTMWTDDAAESFSNDVVDGEDFLYIDDEALAMHWLYTFRLELDPEGDRNITGHWRAPDSNWEVELEGLVMENRGDLSNVAYLVIAPEIDVEALLASKRWLQELLHSSMVEAIGRSIEPSDVSEGFKHVHSRVVMEGP